MNTCKHQGCSCQVQERQPYCSKHCSEAKDTAERSSGCACGHAECGGHK